MTSSTEKEDEQWLNALAGQPDPDANRKVNLQASSLRRALIAQKKLIDAEVPIADAIQYERLLFRMRKEGLTGTSRLWTKPLLWGMVATVVLGVSVVVKMGGLYPDPSDKDILMGGSSTVLIVEQPEVRLAELMAGIRSAGEEPTIKRESEGKISLTVKATEKVLDFLYAQRIEPMVHQGTVTIELQRVRAKN